MTDPDGRLFRLASIDSEPIERVQESDDTAVYKRLKVLQAGTWTDSGSRETVWYSPEGLSNLEIMEDNTVNLMHDAQNDVSAVGRMVPGSATVENGGLYADLEIDLSTAAGEYADENLQTALETQGAKGFGGPSVEIPADGQVIEFNESKGMPELKAGKLSGLGLVANPASKPVSFSRQTAERAVALSDSQTVKGVYRHETDMSPDIDAIRSKLNLSDDLDDDTILALAEAGALSLESDEDEEEEEEEDVENEDGEDDDPEEEEDEAPDEEGEDDEGDDVEIDMEDKIQSLEERLSNVEDMMEQAMQAEELSEELEEATQDLADAETVQELSDAKEELEKRLSALEDEPEEPRTLADTPGEDDEWFDADPGVNYSGNSL